MSKPFLDRADGDQGIGDDVVPGELQQGRKDQRDAVAQRDCGDVFRNVPDAGGEEHDTEQESQVVLPGQHMGRTEADVLQAAAFGPALPAGIGEAMGDGQHGCQEQRPQAATGADSFEVHACLLGDGGQRAAFDVHARKVTDRELRVVR